MKRIILVVILLICFVVPASAFEIGDVTGRMSVTFLKTDDPIAKERINLLPHVQYKDFFLHGDYNFDYKQGYSDAVKYQQKTLIGMNLIGDLSIRYQYENVDMWKDIVPANPKKSPYTKHIQSYDNRAGVGYKFKFNVYDTKIVVDTMVLKERFDLYRPESNIVIENKYFRVLNQLYYDYNTDGERVKSYDRLLIAYKVTENFHLQYQANWLTGKDRVQRVGISFVF